MHRILVEAKRRVSDSRFLHALNYCMLLPGHEAQQPATYIGWLMHRIAGGILAGGLFVLPGIVAIMGLSMIYAAFGHVGIVGALFFGLKAAVLAILLQAVVRVGKRALQNAPMRAIAAVALVAMFFVGVPFPLIILAAGLVGFFGGRAGLFIERLRHNNRPLTGALSAITAAVVGVILKLAIWLAIHTVFGQTPRAGLRAVVRHAGARERRLVGADPVSCGGTRSSVSTSAC